MYDVHLVNYNNTAYLPGTEISSFFWETNKLRAMVSKEGWGDGVHIIKLPMPPPHRNLKACVIIAIRFTFQLRSKRLNIPNKVVCQEDDPDLFDEFKK
jgi:hypothetical protein